MTLKKVWIKIEDKAHKFNSSRPERGGYNNLYLSCHTEKNMAFIILYEDL